MTSFEKMEHDSEEFDERVDEDESSTNIICTPPKVREAAENASKKLLPPISEKKKIRFCIRKIYGMEES